MFVGLWVQSFRPKIINLGAMSKVINNNLGIPFKDGRKLSFYL